MQNVSQAYKDSMRIGIRHNGYIKAIIGVFNANAQNHLTIEDEQNKFTYFANPTAPLEQEPVDHLYATFEQDYTLADGKKYFLPHEGSEIPYNSGMVTDSLLGSIIVRFTAEGIDIRGLTIDFGENYPIDFTIENDEGIHTYNDNDRSYWTTEDVFRNTSYFKITPIRLLKGSGRLRIHTFLCGIANIFTNSQVTSGGGFTIKEFVSPISETLPSQDMTLTVQNYDLYYNPDNPDSSLAFMDAGQEVRVQFGYDVTGNGDVEWLEEQTCYLKTWTADDSQAKFTATDIFDFISGTYYKGIFRQNGISLYDLAIDVLHDAGLTDEDSYYIDPYLKKVVVYNPMPAVKYTEALQIIANAGRCVLYPDRQKRVHIQSSFVPDMSASANNQTEFSHVDKIIKDEDKDAYAMYSRDFSVADGSLFFLPRDKNYLNTGYISKSIADENGLFSENPKITVRLEAPFSPYGMLIKFRQTAAQEFKITTYFESVKVEEFTIEQSNLTWENHEQYQQFDMMEIEFIRGYPNSRVTVDKIQIGEITDYHLTYREMTDPPKGTRQNKIKSINVQRTTYIESQEEKDIKTEEISLAPDNLEYTLYLKNPAYDFTVSVVENESVTCEVVESSCYFVKLLFSGVNSAMVVKYTLKGKEYIVDTNWFVNQHNANGDIKEWKNPLISTQEHAKDLEEWLASYFIGDVDYSINWRGDPAVDANDLFYLDLKDRQTAMIRAYESTLKFGGAWSGTMKARKVVR